MWAECVEFRIVDAELRKWGFRKLPEDEDERYLIYVNGNVRATVRKPNTFGMLPETYADQGFYSADLEPPKWPLDDCGSNG